MTRVRRLLIFALIAIGTFFVIPGSAEAHAHLVRADLAPDSHVHVPAGTVRFWFDETLNSSLSKIVIRDAQGRQVNTDQGQVNPANGEELDVSIPALTPGQYTVLWTSDSAQDGHILHGFYVFTAGGSGAAAIGSGSGGFAGSNTPQLDSTAWAGAIAHWLVLLASTIWAGALVLELLVLTPVRFKARGAITALANRASARIVAVVQFGLLATLAASVLEIETQVYASGGDVTSFTVLREVLHSHFGTYWLARLVCLFFIQLALLLLPETSSAVGHTVATRPSRLSIPMLAAGVIGLAYLLALALSGHAAAVPQMVATSVLLDWLHLLANSIWIGGMIAIAIALVPALIGGVASSKGDGNDTRLAFLVILNRYSPLALIAVPTATVTGIFNAQVHLDSLDAFFNSLYGRFLIIKLVLIAAILLLSASHVFFTRPRLMAALSGHRDRAIVTGFSSLLRRLALEPVLGAGILLCVALMGQVAPAVTVFSNGGNAAPAVATASPTKTPEPPRTISGARHLGLLDVALTINPAAVGHARIAATVREHGHVVPDGQVRVKLSMPDNPSLGATFVETTASGGSYNGAGDLVQNGRWRADVLVRTHSDPSEFRDVPLEFIVGPGAGFLPTGLDPSAITVSITPGRLNAANTVVLGNLNVPSVQLGSQSLDMDMGVLPQSMQPLGGGRWRASGLYAPMQGRWGLTVQVNVNGTWTSVRQFVYQVPLSGPIRLLSGSKGTAGSTQRAGATGTPTSTDRPFGVSFALHLPYTAVVSQMGSNGVRILGKPLLRTGSQAHGVDVMDGTHFAFVTNFGAEPGTVSKIDIRTMKVLQTYTVGLGPAHIIFTPDHRRAFVTDFRSSDLYELDLQSGTTQRITFPNDTCFEPHGIDLSEDEHTLYVACGGGSWIYTVDAVTLKVGKPIITAPGAFGVIVDGPRREVWVTNQTANSLSVVDEKTQKTLTTIPVGKGPALLAVSPDGRTIYVADQSGNQVSVVDAASRKVTATIPVAAQPHGPDVTADGKYLYVASIAGNVVTIIRTSDNKVVAIVPSLAGANEVAIAK
ncbi:MAG: copper resistance protein CopC [Chloroflexi bacterium]|nr:copper resistance protein CopC [Chloroflexota bacterium]